MKKMSGNLKGDFWTHTVYTNGYLPLGIYLYIGIYFFSRPHL